MPRSACHVGHTRAQVYRTQARSPRAASDFVGAKGIAQPDEPPRFERDHVETARRLVDANPRASPDSAAPRAPAAAFLPADARRRAAILRLRARPDFDEHQRTVTVAHHQIDLTAATRHITRDEAQRWRCRNSSARASKAAPTTLDPVGLEKLCGRWRGANGCRGRSPQRRHCPLRPAPRPKRRA
jgi:hypothetical protein